MKNMNFCDKHIVNGCDDQIHINWQIGRNVALEAQQVQQVLPFDELEPCSPMWGTSTCPVQKLLYAEIQASKKSLKRDDNPHSVLCVRTWWRAM